MNYNAAYRITLTGLGVVGNAQYITGKVLDVGCGSKPYKHLFPECEWVGLDIRPVGDIQADAMSIPVEDDSFDTVLCIDALQYVLAPQAAMKEMARVVKPGGHVIVAAPDCTREDSESYFSFRVMGLGAMAEMSGLEIVELKAGGRIWEYEFADWATQSVYGIALPQEIQGFIAMLDEELYPQVAVLIGRKKEDGNSQSGS